MVIHARDDLDNQTASVTVRFFVDSVAPVVNSINPSNNTFSNTAASQIVVDFLETGTGLDLAASTMTITRDVFVVEGDWAATANTLTFVPVNGFVEGDYQVNIRLTDNVALQSPIASSSFTFDQTPPPAPVVDALLAVTRINVHTVTGSKEAYAAIWLNGTQVLNNTADESWSYAVPLINGENSLRSEERRVGKECRL